MSRLWWSVLAMPAAAWAVESQAPVPATAVTVAGPPATHERPDLPPSVYLTPEGARARERAPTKPFPMAHGRVDIPGPAVDRLRHEFDEFAADQLRELRAVYPVKIESRTVAGVGVYDLAPQAGIAPENRRRVLINLPGGGFLLHDGRIDATPFAAVGGIRVISVAYRLGPEHHFPAASEDVAAVYREVLKEYAPQDVGIFGLSAGGVLTGQALAWFQKEQLPMPGAIAVICAGAGSFDGDSHHLWGPEPRVDRTIGYLKDVDERDPLVSPMFSLSVLAKFPPALVLTSTRAVDMSAGVFTDLQLTRAGVASELHLWDGLGHCGFIVDPRATTMRESVTMTTRFFARHLGAR